MTDNYFSSSDFKDVGYSTEIPETYTPEQHVHNRDFTFNAPPPPPQYSDDKED